MNELRYSLLSIYWQQMLQVKRVSSGGCAPGGKRKDIGQKVTVIAVWFLYRFIRVFNFSDALF